MATLANKMNRIRFDSMVETLQAASAHEKSKHVPKQTAEEFNKLLADFGEANPDLKPHLPAPIRTTGPGAMLGITAMTFLAFEMLMRQMAKLFDHVEGD